MKILRFLLLTTLLQVLMVTNAVSDEITKFCLSQAHIDLIRQARIVWDPTENGAPLVNPEMPFGSKDVLGDTAVITGLDVGKTEKRGLFSRFLPKKIKLPSNVQEKAAGYIKELLPAMQVFLLHASLEPGEYRIRAWESNKFSTGATAQVDFYQSEAQDTLVTMQPPAVKDGQMFKFTEEHRKLLSRVAMFLEVNYWSEEDPDSYYPLPAIDPKRPYGDMTYYPIDIADELGIARDGDENDEEARPFELPKLKKMVDLHLSMLAAFTVFISNASLEPGVYLVNDDALWETSKDNTCK